MTFPYFTVSYKMMDKKIYTKPEVQRIDLDNTITLQMQSVPPADPPIRTDGSKGKNEPFTSPFGDKPFG